MADDGARGRLAAAMAFLANPRPSAPAPENNNPKVFQCISDYIYSKRTKYYPNDNYKVNYANEIPQYRTFSLINFWTTKI